MPRRHILTERQHAALFDLPTDDAALLRHYTLADDDIEHIRARRRAQRISLPRQAADDGRGYSGKGDKIHRGPTWHAGGRS